MYDLLAVVIHHGATSHSGHYTAVVRDDDNWLLCDDSTVSKKNVFPHIACAPNSTTSNSKLFLSVPRPDNDVARATAKLGALGTLEWCYWRHRLLHVNCARSCGLCVCGLSVSDGQWRRTCATTSIWLKVLSHSSFQSLLRTVKSGALQKN